MKTQLTLENYFSDAPIPKTTINWWELPDFRDISISFDFQKQLFDRLLKKYPMNDLASLLKKHPQTIKGYCKTHREISIATLKTAIGLVNIEPNAINPQIIEVSGIFSPKLPFQLSNEIGAELRLAFLSDGHNPKDSSKNLKYQAGELESHQRIISLTQKLFGDFKVRIDKEKEHKFQSYFPSVLGDVLEFGGVPRGNKTKINPHFPTDILQNKQLLISALRRSFSDEGSCYVPSNTIRLERSVDITEFVFKSGLNLPIGKEVYLKPLKIDFSDQICNLIAGEYLGLSALGIVPRLTPVKLRRNFDETITLAWRLEMTKVSEIKKFDAIIGFLLSEKNQKVKQILVEYRKSNRLDDAISFAQQLTQEKGDFNYHEFAQLLKVHKNRGHFHLRRLLKMGLLLKLEKNTYKVVN